MASGLALQKPLSFECSSSVVVPVPTIVTNSLNSVSGTSQSITRTYLRSLTVAPVVFVIVTTALNRAPGALSAGE